MKTKQKKSSWNEWNVNDFLKGKSNFLVLSSTSKMIKLFYGLRGMGQGFCDDSIMVLVTKCMTRGEAELKIVQNCVTSFMDDPLQEISLL